MFCGPLRVRPAHAEDLNQAIQYAHRNAAGAVVLDAGVIEVEKTILVPSGTQLSGSPSGTFIRAAKGLNAHLLANQMTPACDRGIAIRNLTLNGNKHFQQKVGRGIYMACVTDLLIEDVDVVDTLEHCIHISNAAGTAGRQVVRRCRLVNAGRGGDTSSSGLATTDCGDLIVENVVSDGHQRAGFRLGAKGTIRLSDCYAAHCGDGGYIPVSGSSGVSLRRCAAIECGQVDSQDGFRLVGTRDAVLENCVAYRNQGAGLMLLNGCSNIRVKGGVFTGNGISRSSVSERDSRSGISVKSFGKPNENIILSDVIVSGSAQFGIEVSDRNAANIRIERPHLTGNAAGGIYDNSRERVRTVLDKG